MPIKRKVPVIGFVGFSGSGKTTFLTKVIKTLRGKGFSVAVIKHTHHQFDIDKKGKDSYRFREAGAQQVILGSKRRFVKMVELNEFDPEPSLAMLIEQLDPDTLDFILFEGFKHEPYPKIELNRAAHPKDFMFPNDKHIIALVTDKTPTVPIPIFGLSDIDKVVKFLLNLI